MGELDGRVIIVTGGAQGMGRRHVERCVAAGANVIATDLQDDNGRAVVSALGDAAIFVRHDVTDEAQWAAVIAQGLAKFGKIDGLINNAAILRGACPIEDESPQVFEQTLRVNVFGTWLGIRSVVEPMRVAGGGSIVNISSTAGMKGLPGLSAYGSSKWAVRGLTKVAAKELGRHGIRVNSIHPGGIEGTGMFPPLGSEARERATLRQSAARASGHDRRDLFGGRVLAVRGCVICDRCRTRHRRRRDPLTNRTNRLTCGPEVLT